MGNLLYCHVEDEEVVAFLFGEELKDRERNSFQGIGSTLQILTHLIRKYNGDGKYAGLLKQAKNANFDCACGYDPEGQMEEDFEANSLLDCIYLCREMEYRDVMGSLVDEWKEDTTEWSDSSRRALIDFNTFLGRNAENERLYQEQLKELLSVGNSSARDIISGYKNLIWHYIHSDDYGKAFHLCEKVIENTDYQQIRTLRLFKDILEACFEVAANPGRRQPVCGGGQRQSFRKCRSRAGTEIYIKRGLRRQEPWMILMGNSWSRSMKAFLQYLGDRRQDYRFARCLHVPQLCCLIIPFICVRNFSRRLSFCPVVMTLSLYNLSKAANRSLNVREIYI